MRHRSLGIRNSKGFSLLEAMLAIGVVAITTLSIASFGSFMSTFNKAQSQKTVIYDFKEELITALASPYYWENIVSHANDDHPTLHVPINPELLCVKNKTVCNEGTYKLTVMNRQNVIRFDALNTAAGFDRGGKLCYTFSATQEDVLQQCPFRLEVQWTAICDFGVTSCANPVIRISAQLIQNKAIPVASNFTSTNVSFYLATDIIPDPVPIGYYKLTNSDVLNWGTTVLPIDMTQAVTYTGSMATLTFNVPSGLSEKGGTVTISGTTATYTPPPGYYGRDNIFYTVTGPSGTAVNGTVSVGVMTPHTWLGPTGGGPTGRTSVTSNFCGKVVNGVCDRTSYPAWPDWHYIFNDLCESCDAIFDPATLIATLELSDTYTHQVFYSGAPSLSPAGGALWKKKPVFSQKNGKFGPQGPTDSIAISNMYGTGWPHNIGEKAFSVTGGIFTGSQAPAGVRVTGGVEIAAGTYVHNNGTFILYSVADTTTVPNREDLNVFNAPGTEFYNFQYNGGGWALGDKVGVSIQSSFTVKNDFYMSPQANAVFPTWDYDTFCTWEGGAQVAGGHSDTIIISVEKNISVAGFGGRGSRIGCKAPQIRLVGAGLHTVTGVAMQSFDTRNMTGTSWGDVRTWINQTGVPHLPYLKIADPAVSVKFVGAVGFRRGFDNAADSNIDFSGAALVFASSDAGDVFFRPETNPAVAKNPMKDVFFANTGGGKLVIGSRQMKVTGKVFSFFDNESALSGDGVGGAMTEMHIDGDLALGPGEHYKLQENILYPVRAVMDGVNDQMIAAGNSTWTGPDGQSQFDVVINKITGRIILKGMLQLHRDFIMTKALGGYIETGLFSLYVPDKGDNTYAQTIRIDEPNFVLEYLFINHNVKIPVSMSVGISLGVPMNIGGANTHSTKTIEPGPGVIIRSYGLVLDSSLQASAPDKPIRVIGGNSLNFKLASIPSAMSNATSLTSLQPAGTTMDIPNMKVEVLTGNGAASNFTYRAKVKMESMDVRSSVKGCMYQTYTTNENSILTLSSLSVAANSGLMWGSGTATATSSVIDPAGMFAQSSGAYPCP